MRKALCALSACLCGALLVASPHEAAAQDAEAQAIRQEIDRLREQLESIQKQYGERLSALEARLDAAAGPAGAAVQPAAAVAVQAPPPDTTAVQAVPGIGPVAGGNVFNPDMAVIGDFLGAGGRNPVSPLPAFEMHESEVSLQAVVDPYARADFFLSFGQQGVDLEEGYLTFPALPGGLLVRAGKMRAAFGKVNTLHTHILPWADRPLVTTNLLGGDEGISDAGISVARLIPNPWLFLEATGQVLRGEAEDVFQTSRPRDLAYVGHLRGYQDLTENTNVDLGVSYARGRNGSGLDAGLDRAFATDLFGFDGTVRWKPLQRAIYRSFIGRSELVWSRRQQPFGTARAFGLYASGDYQFARRWTAGARYDLSDRADNGAVRDHGQSLLLTYAPSEFSRIRGQYRRTRYAGDETAHELLLQLQFAIGAHAAHPF